MLVLKVFLLYSWTFLNKDMYWKLPAGPDLALSVNSDSILVTPQPANQKGYWLLNIYFHSHHSEYYDSFLVFKIRTRTLPPRFHLLSFHCVINYPTNRHYFKPTATEIQNQKQILNKM